MVGGGGLAIIDSGEGSRGEGSGVRGQGSEKSAEPPTLGKAVAPKAWICRGDLNRRLDRYQAIAERLLIGDRAADVEEVARREPVKSLLGSAAGRLASLGIDPMQADIEAHYKWIDGV